jgi:hypothetical protein
MRRSLGVTLVLISAALLPEVLLGQTEAAIGAQQEPESGFVLGTNYPNPINPDTRIPFDLFESIFPEGRPANVTIRIFNILRQYVASPTALGHPAGDGAPVIDLEYASPGHYEAYWDGRDRSGSYVASGVYYLELIVNGRSQLRRILVAG